MRTLLLFSLLATMFAQAEMLYEIQALDDHESRTFRQGKSSQCFSYFATRARDVLTR